MENLIAYGSAIKATTNDDGSVTVAGYLVRFGSADDTDLAGDFFTKSTNFGPIGREGGKVSLFYHHGLDATIKRREIGEATITPGDEGLWLEAQLKARDDYEKKYFPQMLALISAGKAGLSSGAPSWVVDMEPLTLKSGRKVRHITQWPIGEASITPTPAEIRNVVTTIKSLDMPQEGAKAESLSRRIENIHQAFRAAHPEGPGYYPWVAEVFEDHVIAEIKGSYYRIPYSETDGEITFADAPQWEKVERRVEWEAVKALDALVQQTSDFLLEQALDTLITNTNGQTA